MANERISAGEYETWLTPSQTLTALDKLGDAAVETILRRLKMGQLRAVARRLTWRTAGHLYDEEYVIIDPDEWLRADDADHPAYAFWTAIGDLTFGGSAAGTYDPFAPDVGDEIAAFHVRFDPVGIESILPSPPLAPTIVRGAQVSKAPAPIDPFGARKLGRSQTPVAVTPKVDQPGIPATGAPVTYAEVEAWADALPPETRALGQIKLWDIAKTHFVGRKVVRKLIEPLTRGRDIGRKPTG